MPCQLGQQHLATSCTQLGPCNPDVSRALGLLPTNTWQEHPGGQWPETTRLSATRYASTDQQQTHTMMWRRQLLGPREQQTHHRGGTQQHWQPARFRPAGWPPWSSVGGRPGVKAPRGAATGPWGFWRHGVVFLLLQAGQIARLRGTSPTARHTLHTPKRCGVWSPHAVYTPRRACFTPYAWRSS